MTNSRAGEADLLQAIAGRLGRQHGPVRGTAPATPASAWWDPSPSLPDPPAAMDRGTMAQRFVTELTRLGGHGLRVGSPAEAVEYVRAVAAGGGTVVWDDPLLARLELAEALSNAGLEVTIWSSALERSEAKSLAAAARTGVTSAAWGVAETGSIVLPTGAGQGRLVSLLPPVHVALLPEERLVPSVAELFRVLARETRAGAALPSSLSLATGPSRSADIENDLTIGVHGPVEVHVVLLGPASDDRIARA